MVFKISQKRTSYKQRMIQTGPAACMIRKNVLGPESEDRVGWSSNINARDQLNGPFFVWMGLSFDPLCQIRKIPEKWIKSASRFSGLLIHYGWFKKQVMRQPCTSLVKKVKLIHLKIDHRINHWNGDFGPNSNQNITDRFESESDS